MTIKELRTKLGMSQREFSKAAGIARSALQKYENGESRPTTMVLQRIWGKFGCVVDADDSVAAACKKPEVIIQSPLGGEISADEIIKRVGNVDEAYVRVDHNMIYWVKGDEKGEIPIWE